MVGIKTLNKFIRKAKSLGVSDDRELDDFIVNEPDLDGLSGSEYETLRSKLGI